MIKIKTVCIPHKIRIPLREGARGGAYGQQQLLFTYLKFKKFGPDLPLLFKLHEISQLISGKSLTLLPPDVRF